MPEFYMIPARKINKTLEVYMIVAIKMVEFYIIIARKIFCRFFFGGGGVPSLPPSPTPMLFKIKPTPGILICRLGFAVARRFFAILKIHALLFQPHRNKFFENN